MQTKPSRNKEDLAKRMMEFKRYAALRRDLMEEAKNQGIGLGDMVKKVTDFLGIEPCPRCIKWRQIMNKIQLLPNGKVKFENGLPAKADTKNDKSTGKG